MIQLQKISKELKGNELSANDLAFFERVWSTPENIYSNRLKAIGFNNLNTVLDAGFGMGQWAVKLAKLNKKVFGIEYTENRVRVVSKIIKELKIKNLEISKGNIEKTRFKDNQFDGVFSYSVLYQTNFLKSFNEVYRILKPRGKFYFSTNDLGWQIFNIINDPNETTDFSARKTAIQTLKNTIDFYTNIKSKPPYVMPMDQTNYILKKIGFKKIEIAMDGEINKTKIKTQSFYKKKEYDLVNVYEILCEK